MCLGPDCIALDEAIQFAKQSSPIEESPFSRREKRFSRKLDSQGRLGVSHKRAHYVKIKIDRFERTRVPAIKNNVTKRCAEGGHSEKWVNFELAYEALRMTRVKLPWIFFWYFEPFYLIVAGFC